MSSRVLVAKAVAAWQADHPDQRAPCYIADVSDQCGEVWDALVEWLTAEGRPAGDLMLSGVGPLLWVRSGHVVLHVAAPRLCDANKLAAVSHSVFVTEADPTAAADACKARRG